MFCGVKLSKEFFQEMRVLNLDVFYMRNFRYHNDLTKEDFFNYCNSLKTLYVMHPDRYESVYIPEELKKLVIYCPKSSKNYNGLWIEVEKCHALKEM